MSLVYAFTMIQKGNQLETIGRHNMYTKDSDSTECGLPAYQGFPFI